MAGFIDNLRQKPERTRKQIAAGTSATVTVLIFVMWLTVLNYQPNQPETAEITGAQPETRQTASPLSALKTNAAAAFSEISDLWSNWSATTSRERGENLLSEEVKKSNKSSSGEEKASVDRSGPSSGQEESNESFFSTEANKDSRQNKTESPDPGELDAGFWTNTSIPRKAEKTPSETTTASQQAAPSASLSEARQEKRADADTSKKTAPAFNSPSYNPNEGDGWFFR